MRGDPAWFAGRGFTWTLVHLDPVWQETPLPPLYSHLGTKCVPTTSHEVGKWRGGQWGLNLHVGVGLWSPGIQRKEGVLHEAEDPAGFVVDSSPSLLLSAPPAATPTQLQLTPSQPSNPKFDVTAACTFQVAPQRLRLPDFCLQCLGPFPLPSPPSPTSSLTHL